MKTPTGKLRSLAAPAALGAAIGAAFLPTSLEISVTLSPYGAFLRSLMLFLYPLGVACVGLGALAELRFRGAARGRAHALAFRAAGLLLLLFLAASLRFTFFSDSGAAFAAACAVNLAALCLWFSACGFSLAGYIREAAGTAGPAVAWGAHLAGLIAGYAVSLLAVGHAGAGAALLACGAALAAGPRLFWAALPAGLLLSWTLPAEELLERLRDLRGLSDSRIMGEFSAGGRPVNELLRLPESGELLFRGWSRFAQVALVGRDEGGRQVVVGYYNFVKQFEMERGGKPSQLDLDRFRRLVYSAFSEGDRLFFGAVGPGRGLLSLPFSPGRSVTAVELDEAVGRLFTSASPELNGNLFGRVDFRTGDARQALCASGPPYDGIVLESAVFSPANTFSPAGTPRSLYTREAVSLYLSRLAPEGLLVIGFSAVLPDPGSEYLPLQVLAALESEGVPSVALACPVDGRPGQALMIVASRDGRRLAGAAAPALRGAGAAGLRVTEWSPATSAHRPHSEPLTDDKPFSGWITMGPVKKALLLAVALAVLAAALAGFAVSPAPEYLRLRLAAAFFLLGAGHTALASAAVLSFRSYFGDPVVTALGVIVWLSAYGFAGSLAAGKLLSSPRSQRALPLLIAAAPLPLLLLPDCPGPQAIAWVLAGAALLPAGFLSGMLFPAGLELGGGERAGTALFSDAAGSLAGYSLFYFVCLGYGISAYLWLSCAAYAAAAVLLFGRGLPGRVIQRG